LKSLVLTACGLLIWALGIPAAAAGEYGSGVKSDLPPRLGVEAGIDLSNLYGDVANDMFGSRLGVAGGVFLNLPRIRSSPSSPRSFTNKRAENSTAVSTSWITWKFPCS